MVWFTRSSCDYGGLGGSFRILRQQLQTALPESSGPLLQRRRRHAYRGAPATRRGERYVLSCI